MRKLPPLAAVRVFEAAARHLNFTLAGQELGMTQAAVSYQVRALEERIGLPLFLREKGRVHLTEAGRRAAPLISSAFDTLDDAFTGLREDDEAVLTISVATSFATNWLAPRLGAFQLAHPEIAVRLLASNKLADFTRDEVDVALRQARDHPPELHADRLFPASVTPMASPSWLAANPILTPADTLNVPRLTPDDVWWQYWFEAVGLSTRTPRREGLRLDSQTIEGAVAISGQGLALLDRRLWTRELADGRLVAPLRESATTGKAYWLVCLATRRNVRKIKLFRDWLMEQAARDGTP